MATCSEAPAVWHEACASSQQAKELSGGTRIQIGTHLTWGGRSYHGPCERSCCLFRSRAALAKHAKHSCGADRLQEQYSPFGGIFITENGCACESEESVACLRFDRFHLLNLSSQQGSVESCPQGCACEPRQIWIAGRIWPNLELMCL